MGVVDIEVEEEEKIIINNEDNNKKDFTENIYEKIKNLSYQLNKNRWEIKKRSAIWFDN